MLRRAFGFSYSNVVVPIPHWVASSVASGSRRASTVLNWLVVLARRLQNTGSLPLAVGLIGWLSIVFRVVRHSSLPRPELFCSGVRDKGDDTTTKYLSGAGSGSCLPVRVGLSHLVSWLLAPSLALACSSSAFHLLLAPSPSCCQRPVVACVHHLFASYLLCLV